MATIKIPCLVERKNGAGTSYYWQPSKTLATAGWKPLPLGKDRHEAMRAAEDRNQEVARWRAGDAQAMTETGGTLKTLIARYRREWVYGVKPNGNPKLAEKSRANLRAPLDRLEEWAGARTLDWVTPPRVRALRDEMLPKIGYTPTWLMLKTLRALFNFAYDCGIPLRYGNPAKRFALKRPPSRKQVWELEHEAAFKAAAHDLGYPDMALAMDLALYTAGRTGDLIAMNEAQLQPLTIRDQALRSALACPAGIVTGWCYAQEKTSTDEIEVRLEVPLEQPLLARIEAALRHNRARDRAQRPPRLLSYVLVDDQGAPWTKRKFRERWDEIAEHAADCTGLEEIRALVWHDLRRTAVVRMRRMGIDPSLISSITGHSLAAIDEMLSVYGPIDPTITARAIVARVA